MSIQILGPKLTTSQTFMKFSIHIYDPLRTAVVCGHLKTSHAAMKYFNPPKAQLCLAFLTRNYWYGTFGLAWLLALVPLGLDGFLQLLDLQLDLIQNPLQS